MEEKINKELESTPDPGVFTSHKITYWDDWNTLEWVFDGHGILIMLRDSGADEDHEWTIIDEEKLPAWAIRKAIRELPAFIEHAIQFIEEVEGDYDEAIEILKKYDVEVD